MTRNGKKQKAKGKPLKGSNREMKINWIINNNDCNHNKDYFNVIRNETLGINWHSV